MAMKQKLGFLILCLGLNISARAQMSAISATVVDSDSTTWANGSWKIAFLPNPSQPNIGVYNINGTPLSPSVINQSGALDGSGNLSVSVYQQAPITPVGSQWQLTVCPNAITACGVYNFTAVGSSMNLSSALTPVIPAPRFRPVAGAFGYNDGEAIIQLGAGSTYWNTTSGCQRYYNSISATWACYNGASSSLSLTTTGTTGASTLLGTILNIPVYQGQISLTTTGSSGPATLVSNVLNIPQYAGGGGGTPVTFAPAGTTATLTGSSINGDDGRIISNAITVTSGSSSAGVCTVNNSGSNGLSVGDWIWMGAVTGWPATTNPFGTYTYGSASTNDQQFQVIASGLTSSVFKFNCPSSGSVTLTGGTAYTANYWFPHQVEKQPFFNGHITINYIEESTSGGGTPTCNGINTNFNSLFPDNTGSGHPAYLILTDCHNDYNSGSSASTVEGYIQGIAAKAHTRNYIFVLGTTPSYGIAGLANGSESFSGSQVNYWSYTQGKSLANISSGQYWDILADFNSALSQWTLYGGSNAGLGSAGGNAIAAPELNKDLAIQNTSPESQLFGCYFGNYTGVLALNSGPGIVCSPNTSVDAFVITSADSSQTTVAFEADTTSHSSVETGIRAPHVQAGNVGSSVAQVCTDSNGYFTASSCKGAAFNGTSGYQILASGLILEWGSTGSIANDTPTGVTFPLAFPTAALSVVCSDTFAGSKSAIWSCYNWTTTGFTGRPDTNTATAQYFAIGY